MKDAFIICLLLVIAIPKTECVVAGGVVDLVLTEKPKLSRRDRRDNENLSKLKQGAAKKKC